MKALLILFLLGLLPLSPESPPAPQKAESSKSDFCPPLWLMFTFSMNSNGTCTFTYTSFITRGGWKGGIPFYFTPGTSINVHASGPIMVSINFPEQMMTCSYELNCLKAADETADPGMF